MLSSFVRLHLSAVVNANVKTSQAHMINANVPMFSRYVYQDLSLASQHANMNKKHSRISFVGQMIEIFII